MFVFQTAFKSEQQSPYGQHNALVELFKQSDNPKNAADLYLQSMKLGMDINKFLTSFTHKDLGVTERHLKGGFSDLWASPMDYPKAREVLSSFLSQLKPAEKLVFDNILSCLNEAGYPESLTNASTKNDYTKFIAFALTKHVVAYKNGASQSDYTQSAYNSSLMAANIIESIQEGGLSSLLPSLGGEKGLAGSLSSLFSDKRAAKTLKEGIAKSYEAYVAYKEYEEQKSQNVPLASAGKNKKSEFFA